MKKIKFLGAIAFTLALSASCVASHTAVVTNNPVGSKTGVATAKVFDKDADFSYSAAMKKGNISKVGIAEVKATVFIFPKYTLTITGE
jgi:hypothetical protein